MPGEYFSKPKDQSHKHVFPGCEITPEAVEFGRAIDRYKRKTGRKFPDFRDVLRVATALGYRKAIAVVMLLTACALTQAQQPLLTENFDGFYGFRPDGTWGITRPGWSEQNNSVPRGDSGWFAGWQFAPEGRHLATYRGGCDPVGQPGTISNWMLLPPVLMTNKTRLTFTTRTKDHGEFPDRLQVRFSLARDSVDVGTGPEDLGQFSHLLLDINPNCTAEGYPFEWTEFSAEVGDVIQRFGPPTRGRFAFRYYAKNVLPGGVFYPPGEGGNGNYIGIDDVKIMQGK